MDEATFDRLARDEMRHIEDQLDSVDPDDVELVTSDGVLKLELRDGVTVVLNTQRPARQLWLAAVASAWHFDYDEATGRWREQRDGRELRATIEQVLRERLGLRVTL